jgi:streptomycin 6-kinase
VVAPSVELPAGPHRDGAHVLTFAQHVPHDPDWRPAPALVGRLHADLHSELRGYPGDLPVSGPLADLERALDLVAARLPDGALEVVRAEHAELAARWTGWETQALHGDAHPGNLLHTARGPVWFDFEDTWRGPVAWDLACLAGTSRLDGRAVVAAYPGLPAPEQLALFTRARQLFAVLWRFVIAEVVPERRADADATLRTWLIDHPH